MGNWYINEGTALLVWWVCLLKEKITSRYRWVPLKPDILGAWKSVCLISNPAYQYWFTLNDTYIYILAKIWAKQESGLTAVWLKQDPPVTGSDIFPLLFYGHIWPEDKSVVERALHIWPQITAYISETLKKPNSQIHTSNTFSTVKSDVQDSLVPAKLEFFVSVAVIMKPYLEIFQSDAQCLPFITSEIQVMLETLMGKFLETGTWSCRYPIEEFQVQCTGNS